MADAGYARRKRHLLRWVLKIASVLVLIPMVLLAVLLALFRAGHNTPVTLPPPTGHFAVGRTAYVWSDESQPEPLASSPAMRRTVFVWIWYPAARSTAAPADYVPGAWRAAQDGASNALMAKTFTRDLALVQAHSLSAPPVATEQPSYPVVIMRPGGGALTIDFTSLAEDLASHGYIVVGFDAPYRSRFVVFPDGRVVQRSPSANPETLAPAAQPAMVARLLPMWVSDAQFVVDRLTPFNTSDSLFAGRLNLSRLGVFGHSFGGATALQFCHDDRRCKAGIDLDGAPFGSVVQEGVTQPVLFLLSDHGDLSSVDDREIASHLHTIYDRHPAGKLLLMIGGANHFTFGDQMLLRTHYVMRLAQHLTGGLEPRRGLAITRAYLHTFFDVYLNGAPSSALGDLQKLYPEVRPFPR